MSLDWHLVYYVPESQHFEGLVCYSTKYPYSVTMGVVNYLLFGFYFLNLALVYLPRSENLTLKNIVERWKDAIMILLLIALSISIIFLLLLLLFHR